MRLKRMLPHGMGSSAGCWLLPDHQLAITLSAEGWIWSPALWQENGQETGLDRRCQLWNWLRTHGLAQAEFPRRRDALAALEYAWQRDPLPS